MFPPTNNIFCPQKIVCTSAVAICPNSTSDAQKRCPFHFSTRIHNSNDFLQDPKMDPDMQFNALAALSQSVTHDLKVFLQHLLSSSTLSAILPSLGYGSSKSRQVVPAAEIDSSVSHLVLWRPSECFRRLRQQPQRYLLWVYRALLLC